MMAHAIPHRRPILARATRGAVLAALLCTTAALAGESLVPGDLVFVDVYRRPELSTTTQIDSNGNVSLQYIGNVSLAGLNEKDASARLSQAYRKILKNPRVSVSRSAGTGAGFGGAPRATGMVTQIMTLHNSRAETLYEALSGMTSAGGSLGFDPNTNTLIVTDAPDVVQNMLAVIEQLDQMQSQITQVRIESKIAEVKQGAMKNLGVRWFVQGDHTGGGFYSPRAQDPAISSALGSNSQNVNEIFNSGFQNNQGYGSGENRRFLEEPDFDRRVNIPLQTPTVGQMFLGYMNPGVDLGLLLDALVGENQAEVLATPMILAVNHRQATIKMTDEFPFTEYGETGFGAHYSTRFLDLGIKLEVTPHVYRDTAGIYVQLDLEPEVSFYNGASNGVPIRAVRSSESIANVRDGQTLVIGGIVLNDGRSAEQGVPVLRNIPGLGRLFKHKERTKSRNELMVFVTPTVHDKPETITWDRMLNLSVASSPAGRSIPVLEQRRETRKD